MRPLAIVCGLLLAACSTVPARSADSAPQARFSWAGLNLRDPADRATLASRVQRAADDYCHSHSDIVTPHHRREDRSYCPASMRIQLMEAMPPRVRRAYDVAWARRPVG